MPAGAGSAPNGRPDRVEREAPRNDASVPRRPEGWRLAFAAAGLAVVAALAGLLGGRLGQTREAPRAERSNASAPPAQQALPPSIPSATLSQIYDKVAPAVVRVVPSAAGSEAAASGLVVDEDGTVLTSNDVVQQGEVKVVLANGEEVPARVAGTDPEKNLAALRLVTPVPGLVPAELGNSDLLSVGDPVAAIGAPFGLEQTLTSGVVSALGRNFAGSGKTPPLKELIQSDAPINQGAFGGPLVNEAGEVVGINMAIESPVGAFVGVGFAVPINQAKGDLLERIQEV